MTSDTQSCYWPRALIHVRTPTPSADFRSLARIAREYGFCSRVLDRGQLYLDATHRQRFGASPARLASQLLYRLTQESPGRSFQIGVAHEPMLAACASVMAGPGAPKVIAPWEVHSHIASLPVSLLVSSYPVLARRMAAVGLRHCGEITRLGAATVRRHFGETGMQLWHLCRQGHGQTAVEVECSRGLIRCHAVLPPQTRSRRALVSHVRRLQLQATRTLKSHRRIAHTVKLRVWSERQGGFDVVELEALDPELGFQCSPKDLGDRLHKTCGGYACLMLQLELAELENPGPQLELFPEPEADFIDHVEFCFPDPVENSKR
jgi:hypothetical protein